MTRDYILSAEVEDFCKEVPLLDFIYVIPTRRKHDSGYYLVPFKNKMYKIRVEDNVLKHPLYINQIVSWEEYEISLEG